MGYRTVTFAILTLTINILAQDLHRAQLLEQAGQYEPALKIYQKAVEKNPQDLPAITGFIRVCRRLELYDTLYTVINRLKKTPVNAVTLELGLIEALFGLKRRTEAVARVNDFARQHPERLIELTEILKLHRENSLAIRYLQSTLKTRQFRIDYAERLVELYEQERKLSAAVEVIAEIINYDRRRIDLFFDRLYNYGKMADASKIINSLNRIKDPLLRARAQAEVYLGAGDELTAVALLKNHSSQQELYLFARRCEERKALKAALAIYQHLKLTTDIARMLRQLDQVTEALKLLESDTTPEGSFELAEIARIKLRDFTRAVTAYRQVLRHRPDDLPALTGLALALLGLQKVDSAYSIISRINQPDDRALYLKVKLLFYQEKLDSIYPVVEQLTTRFPDSPLLNEALALSLLTLSSKEAKKLIPALIAYDVGDYENCIKNCQQISTPDTLLTQNTLFLLSQALVETGRYQDAINTLKNMIERFPNTELTPRALLRQAEIYQNYLKDQNRYTHLLKQLLLTFPGSPYASIARDLLKKSPVFRAEDLH